MRVEAKNIAVTNFWNEQMWVVDQHSVLTRIHNEQMWVVDQHGVLARIIIRFRKSAIDYRHYVNVVIDLQVNTLITFTWCNEGF
jgi:hypothetical protein